MKKGKLLLAMDYSQILKDNLKEMGINGPQVVNATQTTSTDGALTKADVVATVQRMLDELATDRITGMIISLVGETDTQIFQSNDLMTQPSSIQPLMLAIAATILPGLLESKKNFKRVMNEGMLDEQT